MISTDGPDTIKQSDNNNHNNNNNNNTYVNTNAYNEFR